MKKKSNTTIETYEKNLVLRHNERAAIVDAETGEIIAIDDKPVVNNLPEDKIRFEQKELFSKSYLKTVNFLKTYLTGEELGIVYVMIGMCDMNTNSLKPLDDNITVHSLMEFFDISEKKVKKTFKKLFDLGVYGRFEVADASKDYTKYWILNPYVGFRGKLIDKSIVNLFSGTYVTKAFFNPEIVVENISPIKKKSNRLIRSKQN